MNAGRIGGKDCIGSLRYISLRSAEELRGLRLLVAEDNAVNRMVVAGMLHKVLGLKCDLATNGREAVEAYAREEYDVILMVR